MEEHFFFECNGFSLFGFIHKPSIRQKTGFVFSSPFIEEKVRSQRMYVNFARELASKGHPVLRFDYMGYGDSEGLFEQATLETMIRDTLRAVEVLRNRAEIEDVCLFGGRLGGTVAALASKKEPAVKSLILWDPITDGFAYIYKCLRTNLTMQTLRHKKILYDREKLIQMILDGQHVNIDGYLIGRDFFKSIEPIKLEDHLRELPNDILVVQVAGKELPKENDLSGFADLLKQAGKSAFFLDLKDAFSWEGQRLYRPRPQGLFDATLNWVKEHLA